MTGCSWAAHVGTREHRAGDTKDKLIATNLTDAERSVLHETFGGA
jgi:hypothetical protein